MVGSTTAARFAAVTLVEPTKDELAAFTAGEDVGRRARLSIVTGPQARITEAVVALATGEVLHWAELDDVRPALLFEESLLAIIALYDHPDWVAALARRGITDLDKVQIDPWPTGSFGIPAEEGRRIARCLSYYREDPADNGYARPIEGLLAARRHGPQRGARRDRPRRRAPARRSSAATTPRTTSRCARPPAPLRHHPARRPRLHRRGQPLRWQRWSLRVAMDPHEGLVLHTVGYEDGGRVRPILHRASISEMVVPYGDPGPMHGWKNAFDAGEWGLGRMANSLALGCDCLGEIRYLDAVTADEHGKPWRSPRTPSASTRRTTASSGSTSTCTRGGPRCAVASAGHLLDRHGRELRVRLLLVPLPRRHHPARGEADRHHVDAGRGRPGALRTPR